MSAPTTQRKKVERILLDQGRVSAHDLVYSHGITRAAAIIHVLKNEGWVINTERGVTHIDGTREMAVYVLVRPPAAVPPTYDQGRFW